MDLRVLNYFIMVVKEGNISKAAQILNMTQPTLSRQLMNLEKELGTKLFTRGKREITLTEDGAIFLERATEILELTEKVSQEFMQKRDSLSGVITIGCAETVGGESLMRFIADFHKKYPKVTFDIINGDMDLILMKMDKGIIDMACVVEPLDLSKYDYTFLPEKDRWGLLVKSDDELAGQDGVTIEEIRKRALDIPWLHNFQNDSVEWFGKREDFNVVSRHNVLSNSLHLVEEGIVSSITLEGSAGHRENPKVSFVPIKPPVEVRSVLVWKKNKLWSSVSSLFLEESQKYFKKKEENNSST